MIINIPPFDIFGENLGTYAQIKKSFYFWYFQMQRVIEDRIRQDDFRFIQDIWGDWSPGYDADADMVHIREALRDPDHLRAALGYYWGQFDPTRFGSPEWASEQEAAWVAAPRSRCSTCTAPPTAATASPRSRSSGSRATPVRAPTPS